MFILFRIVCVWFIAILLQICLAGFTDFDLAVLKKIYDHYGPKSDSNSIQTKTKIHIKRTRDGDGYLNQTFFNSLESYQVGASLARYEDYPWIARVVHSHTQLIPHMCTAVCIDNRIFMTSARCIFLLKIDYTTVVYKGQRFPAQAFVVSSNQSKQLFDDIGLIVVDRTAFREKWTVAKLFRQTNRTDERFAWFANLGIDKHQPVYKVVGFATQKGIHRIKSPYREFVLTELPVIIDINMCSTIYTFNYMIKGFHVPCYHSCTLKQFEKKDERCKLYHGVDGGAIVHMETQEILGIATWGAYFSKYELPVGFSVPNSRKFYRDLSCATNIRNDDALLMVRGFYQSICETAYK